MAYPITAHQATVRVRGNGKWSFVVLAGRQDIGGKTVDFSEASMIIRIEGASDKVDASIRLLNNYDIVETVRTGKVVMARGEQAT